MEGLPKQYLSLFAMTAARYFAGSRTRVDIPFKPELEQRTIDLIG